ncbi:hypothetical protein Hanom_Chr17g01566191 [Helianthus anomalus]
MHQSQVFFYLIAANHLVWTICGGHTNHIFIIQNNEKGYTITYKCMHQQSLHSLR